MNRAKYVLICKLILLIIFDFYRAKEAEKLKKNKNCKLNKVATVNAVKLKMGVSILFYNIFISIKQIMYGSK